MVGWWDCEQLDELFNRILRNNIEDKIKINLKLLFTIGWKSLFNVDRKKALEV